MSVRPPLRLPGPLRCAVLALCVCTREAVADMHRRGEGGHVFHVSSMSAHRPLW